MFKLFYKLLFTYLFLISTLYADLQLIKKENNDSNTTLLVIAGIHGNEPGSYFAGSILATHYNITSKNLWIVPNLNKDSIMADKRGIYGDMNRKFSQISKDDKDKQIVSEIKKLILSKNVSLVLNLHDGHGFYRKKSQGNIFNPNAWGQTCVIDQCKLDQNQSFGNLNQIASQVKKSLNLKLIEEHHAFDVRNTKTKFEDEQMQLSLTYFAVTNNKPAFAIESSKNLSSLSQKVYYQLLAIEEFMKIMGINFTRNFNFNEHSIEKILQKNGYIRINDNISLDLSKIKKTLSYLPIESKSNTFKFSNLLGNIKKINNNYVVYIGNKKITTLKPQYFELAQNCPSTIEVIADSKKLFIEKASSFSVKDNFKIINNDNNLRVNIIGFKKQNVVNESGILVDREVLNKKFSIDIENKNYRIEFYKDKKFCSMLNVYFK